MTTINLQFNQIGDNGVKDLSSSLSENNVNSFIDIYHLSVCFIKTLLNLFLPRNLIGDDGVKYLGNALQTNRVIEIFIDQNICSV